MMLYTCDPKTWEFQTDGPRGQGQPERHIKTLKNHLKNTLKSLAN